jgi:hypothetical protein
MFLWYVRTETLPNQSTIKQTKDKRSQLFDDFLSTILCHSETLSNFLIGYFHANETDEQACRNLEIYSTMKYFYSHAIRFPLQKTSMKRVKQIFKTGPSFKILDSILF